MMKAAHSFKQVVYYGLSIFFLLTAIHQYNQQHWFTAGLCGILFFVNLMLLLKSTNTILVKAQKMVDAIREHDFSSVPSKGQHPLLDSIHTLHVNILHANKQQVSQQQVFGDVLNELDTGIFILEAKQNEWNVIYANPEILKILAIPRYKRWIDYKRKIPEFFNLIEHTKFENSQSFWDISVQGEATRSYSLRTKRVIQSAGGYFIITLESVQRIIEQKEKMAWHNLMKVISHELLNTLTPVNSLIQNLSYISQQDEINDDDREEMTDSLKVISSKSEQLLSFINDYRQVAELPRPRMALYSLNTLVKDSLKLLRVELDEAGISVYKELDEIQLAIDVRMVQQAINNLLLNAIYALKEAPKKELFIRLFQLNKRIVISIRDTGHGIPDEIKQKILLPFFTTRVEGSGIGLTLTKHIMESHEGYLHFENDSPGARFELWFTLE